MSSDEKELIYREGLAISRKQFVDEVLAEAEHGTNPITNNPVGDILVFVHGFNNSSEEIIDRHRKLKKNLKAEGYQGTVISFDWPCAASALNYWEDRDDAEKTAHYLRDDCINLFSVRQSRGCEINVHLLGHSTGAYVIRRAFRKSNDHRRLRERAWTVSQMVFISADVASCSLTEGNPDSMALYDHCMRLTNYQNSHDSVLKLSNTKRIGLAPRAGRVGLPDNAHGKGVNVSCGEHFSSQLAENVGMMDTMMLSHSWHFDDMTFARDLAHTLKGDIDRGSIPTRKKVDGRLVLDSEA